MDFIYLIIIFYTKIGRQKKNYFKKQTIFIRQIQDFFLFSHYKVESLKFYFVKMWEENIVLVSYEFIFSS